MPAGQHACDIPELDSPSHRVINRTVTGMTSARVIAMTTEYCDVKSIEANGGFNFRR